MNQFAAPEVVWADLSWAQRVAMRPQQLGPVIARSADCTRNPSGTAARLTMWERLATVQGKPAVDIAVTDAVDSGAAGQRDTCIVRGKPYELHND
jgi:hypothetical protein